MRPEPRVHDALARLVEYPGEGGREAYARSLERVRASLPECAAGLDAFERAIAPLTEGELEELYARTFDHVAERSLEVGWQLFGESYARGALLVRLRGLLRQAGVAERTELPDHLIHVLPLLGRAPERVAAALAAGPVGQAAAKLSSALCAAESPWAGVLEAICALLRRHVEGARPLEVSR